MGRGDPPFPKISFILCRYSSWGVELLCSLSTHENELNLVTELQRTEFGKAKIVILGTPGWLSRLSV